MISRRIAAIGLFIAASLTPFVASAQQEVMVVGVDANGVVRPIQVDGNGSSVVTNTNANGTTTAGTFNTSKQATSTTISTVQTTALTSNPTACSTPGGASCTIIYTSTDWSAWPNLTITVYNTDGANSITNLLVEWSPDGSHWEKWDSTTFAALASGTTKSIAIAGNSRKFLRLEAQASSNVSSANVIITANQG